MGQNLFGNDKVLVTGASGLIGAHLIISLLEKGVQVRALVRNKKSMAKAQEFFSLYSSKKIDLSLLEWYYADITDYEEVLDAVENMVYVFHCAGFVSFNEKDSEELFNVNVIGTLNVVDASLAHHVKKLCHVSSVAALGKPLGSNIVTEECDFDLSSKRSAYANSKYLSEMEVWRGHVEGVASIIVNPTVVIGPGQWNQSSGKLFSTIAKGMKYYTTGVTGYVGVNDVVECMQQLMSSNVSNERFILNSENVDYKTIFETIAEGINKPTPTKKANPMLMKVGAVVLKIKSLFSNEQSQITSNTIRTAFSVTEFSNCKVKTELDYEFKPIKEVILSAAKFFPN